MPHTYQAEFVCLNPTSSEEVTLGKENGLLRFVSACALSSLPLQRALFTVPGSEHSRTAFLPRKQRGESRPSSGVVEFAKKFEK